MSDGDFRTVPHQHRYFAFQAKNSFEPVTDAADIDSSPLYRMVEYAYATCNCGASVKTVVKQK